MVNEMINIFKVKKSNVLYLGLILTVVACAKASSKSEEPGMVSGSETQIEDKTLSPTPTWTSEFMELVNDHRRSIGLSNLIHLSDLAKVAQTHSKNMANKSVAFGHTGFASRCSAARVILGGANLCAENVASGQKSPKAAFEAWMNSSGHRANIEQGRSTHTGFGYAQTTSGSYYWTQIFLERN